MVELLQRKIQSFYKSKNILITGASGYIAWNVINRLSEIDCSIRCLTRKSTNNKLTIKTEDNHKANIKIVSGSYDNKKFWKECLKEIDIVFHLAAQTSFYKSEDNPVEDFKSNVYPMQLLLEAARQSKLSPYVVFAGTATQCGLKKTLPIAESVKDEPSTVYDFHKLLAENYLKYYTCKNLIKGTSLRLCNVYGPGPKTSSKDRGILNLMIKKALDGENLTIYGTGNFQRDYIFMDDVVNAFLACPCYPYKTNGRHFILGSGKGHSINMAINMVAQIIKSYMGLKVKVVNIKTPKNLLSIEYRNEIANNSEIKKATGWLPSIKLAEGIAKTIESYTNDDNRRVK